MGAGLGAGTGALAGGLSRHAGAGTAIGAGAGALIGGIMGNQFEQMEKQRASYPPPPPVGGTGPYPINQPYGQAYGQSYPQPYGYPPRVAGSVVRPPEAQNPYEVPQTATAIKTVVSCPNCQQSLDVTDYHKGTKVRCPACNAVFVY